MKAQIPYEERVSSPRTQALFLALTVLPLAALAWRIPAAGMDGWSVFLALAAGMFLFYAINYRTLVIRVDGDALRLRFGMFQWTIPLGNIESCAPDPVSLWRIGGAGIHFTSIGGRYRAMFNFLEHPRLVVGLKARMGPVRDAVFSTGKPHELRALLGHAITTANPERPALGETADAQAVSLAKRALRARCRRTRDDLGEGQRTLASRQICERIDAWDAFRTARTVFTYLPMRGEVDLRALIHAAPGIHWAIPRVVESPEPRLLFHAFQPDRLVPHRYGMLEPDPSAPLVPPEEADVILVPGLAFTRRGFRLGYGGGFYDRLLGQHGPALALGICYQALLLDEIPRGPHDVPVGYLVTEHLGVIPREYSP